MIYEPIPYKRCTQCKRYFPASLEHFPFQTTGKNGLMAWCKQCKNQKGNQWSKQNREKRNAKAREWWTNNPDKAAKYYKRKRDKYPEQQREACRQWRANNPEKARLSSRNHYGNNLDYYRTKAGRRRSKQKALAHTFNEQHWATAISYWHGTCAYCGKPPSLWDRYPVLHQDHFVPVVLGGTYTPDNILPVCQSCNLGKRAQEPEQWITKRFGQRKGKAVLKHIQEYFEWVKTYHN
jgi:5-methylcytosine-specific restriction endonuclease McrA